MKDIGERFGVNNLWTPTLRKTFGYHYYKQTEDTLTKYETNIVLTKINTNVKVNLEEVHNMNYV